MKNWLWYVIMVIVNRVREMKDASFRIRTRRNLVVGFLTLFMAVLALVCVGLRPSFSEAYAKEAAEASGVLEMPSISLLVPVSKATLSGRTLAVPEYIVGEYKIYENKVLLMGHSSTAFAGLSEVGLGDEVIYNGVVYKVIAKEIKPKSEISMRELLEDDGEKAIVLMTCAGQHISGQDYSHRLIVNAVVRGE